MDDKDVLLLGETLILATDNQVLEAAIYKGYCSSNNIYKLVVRIRKSELQCYFQVLVTHLVGMHIMDQWTDGMYRGNV